MRFIFVSFSQSVFPEITEVSEKLKALGHKTVYWIGSSLPTSFIEEDGSTGIVDENFLDFLSDKCNLEIKDFKDISTKEQHIFDFLQRNYSKKAFPELERCYHRLVLYAKWILNEKKPDVIVFRIVPNQPPLHFILYHLARAKGVKTVMFCDTWVKGRIAAMNDYIEGIAELKNIKQDNQEINPAPSRGVLNPREKDIFFIHPPPRRGYSGRCWIKTSDLSEEFQEYYKLQVDNSNPLAPVYVPNILSGYNLWGRVKSAFKTFRKVLELGIFGKMWRTLLSNSIFWFKTHLSNELSRTYKKLSKEADFSKPFIYFPLHIQPEFSTNPLGGYFRDQLLALEILAASLPKDWLIYVKEHPTQWPVGGTRHNPYRPKDYYSSIARFSNVRLIPTDTDTFELIKNSKAVATISGTAAWEAILRGKPSLIFGYPWFKDAPGIYKIDDNATCKNAMDKIEKGETPDKQDVLRYLKRLDDITFRGCLDLGYRATPEYFKILPEEQAKGIFESILRLV